MIAKLAKLRGRVSSHWLASAFAGVYLVLSLILGVALLSMPKTVGPGTTPAASVPTIVYKDSPTETPAPGPGGNRDDSGPARDTTSSPPPPPTRTTAPAPVGYQLVSGPAGVRTAIPTGWPAARTTGPGAMQATDPADLVRFVKYGGSLAPDLAIEPSHVQYENGFAARAVEYRRITLSSARYGGHDAVEWEFEHRDGANLMHVRSLYWRADGKEYFVLAAAPAPAWAKMQPIYETMVANATP